MIRNRLLAVLLLAAAGAAGCSASTGSSADHAAPMPAAERDAGSRGGAEAPQAPEGGSAADQAEPPRAAQVAQPGVDRKLIRTATLEVTSPEVLPAAEQARGIVTAAGGYTGGSEVRSNHARLTLHVPSDQFDRVVGELGRVGTLVSSSQTADDVTEQLVDVDSRITTQRTSVARVRALLAKATDLDEIVRVEAELTRREADLESLLKRRETLSGQVAVSTVTLTIRRVGEPAPVVEEDDGVLGALATGWRAFTDTLGALLRFVAVVLPFAVVIAIGGVLAWRWWRARPGPKRRVAPELPGTAEA
ncbi:DUF4349 domain-containing protein [Actinokineospora sp. 24-640]